MSRRIICYVRYQDSKLCFEQKEVAFVQSCLPHKCLLNPSGYNHVTLNLVHNIWRMLSVISLLWSWAWGDIWVSLFFSPILNFNKIIVIIKNIIINNNHLPFNSTLQITVLSQPDFFSRAQRERKLISLSVLVFNIWRKVLHNSVVYIQIKSKQA